MVFIHGGGFKEGDGNLNTYSPEFLVKKDFIVVTVNYRLGLYGFLCLDEDKYSNQGIKDQSIALKWVKTISKTLEEMRIMCCFAATALDLLQRNFTFIIIKKGFLIK